MALYDCFYRNTVGTTRWFILVSGLPSEIKRAFLKRNALFFLHFIVSLEWGPIRWIHNKTIRLYSFAQYLMEHPTFKCRIQIRKFPQTSKLFGRLFWIERIILQIIAVWLLNVSARDWRNWVRDNIILTSNPSFIAKWMMIWIFVIF